MFCDTCICICESLGIVCDDDDDNDDNNNNDNNHHHKHILFLAVITLLLKVTLVNEQENLGIFVFRITA
jgi:hypothetical protein